MLHGRKIILGVTGSIAAYKAAFLVRLLVKDGAEVKVVMTEAAKEFVGPLTFSVLSKNPVYSFFSNKASGEWTNHVDLALWADAIVIAPASANTIAKMANGICDSLLLAVYLSSRCPVFVSPAMDVDMWKHPSTQVNINKLKSFGNHIIDPAFGELASGLTGEGRMEEPEKILNVLRSEVVLNSKTSSQPPTLGGKKVLVTAGPTHENIDPVRFIGNRSTGKMGFAIARELADQGAEVTLISGPSSQIIESKNIRRIDVESAQEMYDACMKNSGDRDIIVMSAAVADYKPEFVGSEKMSKKNKALILSLTPTKDILVELGKRKKNGQLLVGFALETTDEIENAKEKLRQKNLDLIVLNSLKDEGAGFEHDTNKISIINREMKVKEYPLKLKTESAKDVVNAIVERLKKSANKD